MKFILIDSNVIIDVFSPESEWYEWSADTLDFYISSEYKIILNQVIYAEISLGFLSAVDLDEILTKTQLHRTSLPWNASLLAAQAYKKYRSSGGKKTGVLPDFFIGAHAEVANIPLITRDTRRYKTYFPTISLITP